MKIVQYISELIQSNGSIVIPDFGVFVLKDTATNIDKNKNLITPPSKVLTFDEDIKENDNVLSAYLIKEENISKEAADEAIFKFTFQLKNLLASGKTVDFRNIGKLHTNSKKQIVFDADNKVEYISDSFGLTTIKVKEYSKTKEVTTKVKKEKKNTAEKKPKKFPKAAIWIIVLLIPIIAVATLAFLFPDKTKEIYINTKNSIVSIFQKSNPEKDVKTIASNKDTLKNTIKTNDIDTINAKLSENNEKNATSIDNKPKKEEKPVIDENKKYHIIVGCFQSKQNAENYFKTIEKKGYTPRMFEAGADGLYKISCGSYASREEAKMELKKVTNDIGAQAWILKK